MARSWAGVVKSSPKYALPQNSKLSNKNCNLAIQNSAKWEEQEEDFVCDQWELRWREGQAQEALE